LKKIIFLLIVAGACWLVSGAVAADVLIWDVVANRSSAGTECLQKLQELGYEVEYTTLPPSDIPLLLAFFPGILEYGQADDYLYGDTLEVIRRHLSSGGKILIFGHARLWFLPWSLLGLDELFWDSLPADSLFGNQSGFFNGLEWSYPETQHEAATYAIGDTLHDPGNIFLSVDNNFGGFGASRAVFSQGQGTTLVLNIDPSWIVEEPGFNTKADLYLHCLHDYFGMYPTGVPGDNAPLPKELSLWNYPNPFNATTNINYNLLTSGEVSLMIYNLLGQKVATLVDGWMKAGQHTTIWHATDNSSSGVYFYKLTADSKVITRRMTLLK